MTVGSNCFIDWLRIQWHLTCLRVGRILRFYHLTTRELLSKLVDAMSKHRVAQAVGKLCPCLCPLRDNEIFRACESPNSVELVRTILRRDPKAVHALRSDDSTTPLHLAVILQDVDLVRMFISHKADVTSKDHDGQTPLHVAALTGNAEITGMLVEAAKELQQLVDEKTVKGYSAIYLACWRGHLEVAQLLHSKGAKLNQTDNEGRTMISRARDWNQTRVLEWLEQEREVIMTPPKSAALISASSDSRGERSESSLDFESGDAAGEDTLLIKK
uniref:Uncharacterized protein n=1 Tax=Hanusia phi TaxID=3032 RepID=A0A7S0HBL6_9CRYP|mmetsp:Transcript_14747/g.33878  ORF Transcript_14747/g.33878 Transcript_14747/m.33878 type:complete len:273 (+) Transcript_14747:74-892(+)